MGTKLHEILAVEPDLQNVAHKVTEEAKITFIKRPNHFFGFHKRLKNFDDDASDAPEEHGEITTTVFDKLEYVQEHVARYLDVVAEKERTNQEARADVVIDGKKLLTDMPATFLLGLESKLKRVREMYETIPTLPPGTEWNADPSIGEHVYKARYPEEKTKTMKTFQHKVLYEATDRHPAQIERWEENIPVGTYITERWTGLISSAEKSIYLGRIDRLIRAVKKARQKANNIEIVKMEVGKTLFDYIKA